MKYITIISPFLIVAIAALIRILPHPPNFAPIAAMALFSGCYLDKKYAFFIPLAAMLVSDIFLGFHQSMLVVYGCFVLITLIGMAVKKRKTVATVILASLFSSILFFLITNITFWLPYSLYPKTLEGQLTAYYMAIPFFKNTLFGDLFYTGVLFGGYELLLLLTHRKAVVKS